MNNIRYTVLSAFNFFTSSRESPAYSAIFSRVKVPSANILFATFIMPSLRVWFLISSMALHMTAIPSLLSLRFLCVHININVPCFQARTGFKKDKARISLSFVSILWRRKGVLCSAPPVFFFYLTLTVHVTFLLPDLIVILTVPLFRALILPFELTVAIFLLELLYVIL